MLARFLLPILLCVNIYAADNKNQDSQNYEVLKAKIESVEKQESLRHFDYKQNLDAYKDLMKAQQEQNENILNHLYWIVGSVSGIIIFILTGFGFFIKSNVPRWIGQKIDEKISNDANNAIKELETKTKTAKEAIEAINSELEDLKGLFSELSEDDTKNLKPELKNLLTKLVEISKDKLNKTAQDYYLEGFIASENNNSKLAIEKFKKSLEIKPEDVAAWYKLGQEYIKVGQFEPAYNSLKKASELSPTNANILTQTGIAAQGINLTDEAIKYFNAALAIKDNFIIKISIASLMLRTNSKEFDSALIQASNKADSIEQKALTDALNIFHKVSMGESCKELLTTWDNGYPGVKISRFTFMLIEKWVDSFKDLEIKSNLLTTLEFFKSKLAR